MCYRAGQGLCLVGLPEEPHETSLGTVLLGQEEGEMYPPAPAHHWSGVDHSSVSPHLWTGQRMCVWGVSADRHPFPASPATRDALRGLETGLPPSPPS